MKTIHVIETPEDFISVMAKRDPLAHSKNIDVSVDSDATLSVRIVLVSLGLDDPNIRIDADEYECFGALVVDLLGKSLRCKVEIVDHGVDSEFMPHGRDTTQQMIKRTVSKEELKDRIMSAVEYCTCRITGKVNVDEFSGCLDEILK